MGIAELVQDVRKAKNCGGGEVPEETMGDMVCKIAHRLMQNVRPATFSPDRMAARRKEVERHWKAAIRVAVTATYLQRRSTTQVPAGTTLAVQESVRRDPQQDKREKLVKSAIRRIAAWTKRSNMQVQDLFHRIDVDGSGSIDVSEFRNGLGSLGLKFDNLTMKVLVRHMDDSGDNVLDIDEFCDKMHQMLETEAASPAVVIAGFCNHLHATGMTAATFFKELDEDDSGCLDASEFHVALEKLDLGVTLPVANAAFAELDVDGDGTLQIRELVEKLEEFRRHRRIFAATVLGNICEYVRITRTSIVRVFARVDSDGSGNLDVLELQEAMLRMGQDLSELEVKEVMSELSGEGSPEAMSSPQFLDKLKQFERERIADTEKCRTLFEKMDTDDSGELDREEVRQLAEAMGLADQLQDESSTLTLDRLIDDIENAREDEDEGEDNGLISFDELLPWFLNVGRSYLPPPVYQSVENIDEPSQEELRALFSTIDEDGSGEVSEEEVVAGTLVRWPYLDTELLATAVEAADMDGSGLIAFDEFDELVRCLQFLNEKRHVIDELTQQFEDGLGDDEFYIGLTTLGITVADAESSVFFDLECARHNAEELTIHDFILFACRHECVAQDHAAAEELAVARATANLKTHMSAYGDIFFEDLATVLYTNFAQHARGQPKKKIMGGADNSILAKARGAVNETAERFRVLQAGIQEAIRKHESFPEMPDNIIREFVTSCKSDLFFSGQHIITQGMLEDTFFVIRRGKAEVIIDGDTIGTVGPGDPLGELALMYGTRRSATIRCVGPCEVFYLDRAGYDTGISLLPVDKRSGPLVKIMQRYWDLVSGPKGSNRPEVDYAVYLQYHMRITKTLTRAANMDDYDADEQRATAQQDWIEDTKRFGLKPSDSLSLPMFFDSVYQLVDLWAADLNVSFTEFLDSVFNNIAVWIEEDTCWGFKPLEDVECKGEKFDAIQEEARQQQLESARLKREAEEAAEAYRLKQEQESCERRTRLREKHERDSFLSDCARKLTALDDEEAEILRRLAAGNLTPEEEEALRRRLAEIAQERLDIKLAMNDFQQSELLRRLENGGLSEEEEESLRRRLADLKQAELQLKIDQLDLEETEIKRRLASGLLTPQEEEELRRRLAKLQQDRIALQIEKLDLERAELERRIASGLLTPAEEEAARCRLAGIGLERVALELKAVDYEEAEIRRRLDSGLLTPSEVAALQKRLQQLEKDRIRLQLKALGIEADELNRRLATGLLTSLEEEAARRRLIEIEDERKRLLGLLNPDPRGDGYLDYAARAARMVRDVTTSQVRFSRAERMKRLQSRQQHQAEQIRKKREEEDARRQHRDLQSPARQRQAERRAQLAAQRAAKAARAEEEDAVVHSTVASLSSTLTGGPDGPSTLQHSGHDLLRTWPSAGSSDGDASTAFRHRIQSDRTNGTFEQTSHWSPWPPQEETHAATETHQKLFRPGRTQPVERQIGFGRPLELVKPIAATSTRTDVDTTTDLPGLTERQRYSRAKHRRRRRKHKRNSQRSVSSMAALPSASHGRSAPVRDSAWRQSTYDGRARLVSQDRPKASVWYAEDDCRRFIKGNVVKGALPPVGRPGPGSPSRVA